MKEPLLLTPFIITLIFLGNSQRIAALSCVQCSEEESKIFNPTPCVPKECNGTMKTCKTTFLADGKAGKRECSTDPVSCNKPTCICDPESWEHANQHCNGWNDWASTPTAMDLKPGQHSVKLESDGTIGRPSLSSLFMLFIARYFY